eukprot:4948788-Pleurochrysis_carterae.AAC.3
MRHKAQRAQAQPGVRTDFAEKETGERAPRGANARRGGDERRRCARLDAELLQLQVERLDLRLATKLEHQRAHHHDAVGRRV